jgi:hypothetical protein
MSTLFENDSSVSMSQNDAQSTYELIELESVPMQEVGKISRDGIMCSLMQRPVDRLFHVNPICKLYEPTNKPTELVLFMKQPTTQKLIRKVQQNGVVAAGKITHGPKATQGTYLNLDLALKLAGHLDMCAPGQFVTTLLNQAPLQSSTDSASSSSTSLVRSDETTALVPIQIQLTEYQQQLTEHHRQVVTLQQQQFRELEQRFTQLQQKSDRESTDRFDAAMKAKNQVIQHLKEEKDNLYILSEQYKDTAFSTTHLKLQAESDKNRMETENEKLKQRLEDSINPRFAMFELNQVNTTASSSSSSSSSSRDPSRDRRLPAIQSVVDYVISHYDDKREAPELKKAQETIQQLEEFTKVCTCKAKDELIHKKRRQNDERLAQFNQFFSLPEHQQRAALRSQAFEASMLTRQPPFFPFEAAPATTTHTYHPPA